jgi:acetolactate synthase-1/2/3 large subunit
MAKGKLSGAEILLKVLEEEKTEVVFGYPGGAVLPIYDALFQQKAIRHILVRQEGGAVHAAEGYARSSNRVGVVLVTSGPGATNAVTGLTDALMDSIPIVCLTGQVPTHLIGNDAFQEADTTGITRPCTKHNYLVKDIEDLARVVRDAFYVARTGRPGPVVIDLPKDVLQAKTAYSAPKAKPAAHKSYRPQKRAETDAINRAVELLAGAKRPIFYTGGGVINSGPRASKLLAQFVRKTGYPITSTLMGLGAYPAKDKQFLGMLGMHGTYEANLAMYNCDVMVAVGARFDDRVTGKLAEFAPKAKKIHIDIDPSSINKNIMVDVPVIGDCGTVLAQLIKRWGEVKGKPDAKALKKWWADIAKWRARKCLSYEMNDEIIKPQYALERLQALTRGKDVYFTTEVGQHQMWAAQFLHFDKPNRWLTSGGLGTMGYGLPAAIGAQVAHPKSLVIDVAGESSLLMNMQEFSTAAQYRLPVKVFILNNQYMGMVRQWQELLPSTAPGWSPKNRRRLTT